MKKILLFVLGAALCACTSKNPDDIVVNVEVENMTVSNVGLLIDRRHPSPSRSTSTARAGW